MAENRNYGLGFGGVSFVRGVSKKHHLKGYKGQLSNLKA